MHRKASSALLILSLLLGFCGFTGCGDDDEGGIPSAVAPTPAGVQPEAGILLQTTVRVRPDEINSSARFKVPGAGTVTVTASWAPPEEILAFQIPPLIFPPPGAISSKSPFTYSFTASQTEAITTQWVARVINPSDITITVTITVEFTPSGAS